MQEGTSFILYYVLVILKQVWHMLETDCSVCFFCNITVFSRVYTPWNTVKWHLKIILHLGRDPEMPGNQKIMIS